MKVKRYLPILLSVTASTFVLSGCSDFDNGWTEEELQYRENFAKAFGKIDPEQDWNLATRAAVTVTTASPSEIKIYAKTDGTYRIVADYADVTGTQKLGFDIREDVTDLIVTNGSQSFNVKPCENVTFGAATRAVYTTTADEMNRAGVSVGDYEEFDADLYVGAVVRKDTEHPENNGILPEEVPNLEKVTQNFSYISNGPFTIHPVYWNSSSKHILGVYWKEGDVYHYQDVYEDKDAVGAELATQTTTYGGECTHTFPVTVGMTCDAGHEIAYIDTYGNKYYNVPEAEGTEETCHYLYEKDKWRNVGETCDHGFKITVAGQDIDGYPQKHLNTRKQCSDAFNNCVHVGDVCPQGDKIIYIDSYNRRWTTVDKQYHAIYADEASTTGMIYSKGITINLPVGTLFGFYLKVYSGNPLTYFHTLYSQGELNKSKKGNFFDPALVSAGSCSVRTAGLNHEGTEAWAATFQTELAGQTVQYLCFEDWSTNMSDLNDLVFATPVTPGYTPPSIVDEDADTWIICAEDLGNTFDLDYNDVVVEVSHVSGKEKATITPVAAGGTLASYIYFNNGSGDKCLGEVHELLGQSNATSGEYTPFNVSGTINTANCKNIEVDVASTWSIASSTVGDDNFNADEASGMGGFYVKVVPEGTASTKGNATVSGQKIKNNFVAGTENVPYVFCVPREWSRIEGETKYSGWFRWSKEMTPMSSLDDYDKSSYNTTDHTFATWVADHNAAKDWYKYPNLDNTMGIKGITETNVSVDPGDGGSDSGSGSSDTGSSVTITSGKTDYDYQAITVSEIASKLGGLSDDDDVTISITISSGVWATWSLYGTNDLTEDQYIFNADGRKIATMSTFNGATTANCTVKYSEIKDYTYIGFPYQSTITEIKVKKQ